MLDRDIRTAILSLHNKGYGIRRIARAVGVSRNAVRRVLGRGTVEVPKIEREERAEPYSDRIIELHLSCEGNLARVHEKLEDEGVELAYSTLTAFCRRHGLGVKPKERAGRYVFEPGEEMQHDTSPHRVKVGSHPRSLQCASLVLCFSRLLFSQLYPRWNRFWCKVFLTDALSYFGCTAERCMIDNLSVIVVRGTGRDAVIAPEMEAFGERLGFHFEAHEKGDVNRSARVERPFHYIENNFYKGRVFADLEDLNSKLIKWCDKVNGSYKRCLRARPVELFAAERPALKRLPIHVPEVYEIHQRTVDLEGYVNLHTNRYSVDAQLIGRSLEVRGGKRRVRIFRGHDLVAEHDRHEDGACGRSTLPEHKKERRWRRRGKPLQEESVLRAASPEFETLVDALKKRHGNRAAYRLRHLHRMFLEYPTDALCRAISTALAFGLYDLQRIERMVLTNIAGDFFRLPIDDLNEGDER